MTNTVNLVKLSVGTETVDGLLDWQTRRSKQVSDGQYYHITRMWPKRADELLNGGSIYWVIKGVILARQRVTDLREIIGNDGIRRCGLVLDKDVVRVAATPRKAFQGWRYLAPDDAPPDVAANRQAEEPLPPALSKALADIGVR
ncbi:DUF1489 family protein [Salipiger sp. IMCC34102]|uniref:DUF1489 family protein n=1 Tax=Salipiger sp. IMCC34102 TaxID=2510647 RepID=UPI00101B6119|nr:DUF1489 domain-containing protein [Salipiger sp. IMCC34102]RYH01614.1 DUF1489 family protein [Salipiger sp. IMCC34102]